MLWRDISNGRGRFPWRDANRLLRGVGRLATATGFPAMNVWAGEENAVVTAELPGVSPEEINIAITGDTVTLSGSRQRPEAEAANSYHRQERGYGPFSRS